MNTRTNAARIGWLASGAMALLASLGLASAAASSHMKMSHGAAVALPAAEEFGFGPRASAQGLYVASLEPLQPLRPGRMQTVRIVVRDGEGQGIDGATIAVDGGMPQHGHGLPTRPRVVGNPGGGVYEMDGLRFNMGGWWQVTLVISGPQGVDQLTFNLQL